MQEEKGRTDQDGISEVRGHSLGFSRLNVSDNVGRVY